MDKHELVTIGQCAWCGAFRAGEYWLSLGVGLYHIASVVTADGRVLVAQVSHGACPACAAEQIAAARATLVGVS